MYVAEAPFTCSAVKVSSGTRQIFETVPPSLPFSSFPSHSDELQELQPCISNPLWCKNAISVPFSFRLLFSFYYSAAASFTRCCIPLMSLKQNNEDLQNAKRHISVSLIAAYQSLKQMAYPGSAIHCMALSSACLPATLRRGDLWKIMRTEDYGIIHFINHFLRERETQHICRAFYHFDNHYYCNY